MKRERSGVKFCLAMFCLHVTAVYMIQILF